MSLSDGLSAVLEKSQQAYEQAELFNTWKPDDGTYNVLLTGVRGGTKQDRETKQDYFWFSPEFEIIDGAFEGKRFTDFMTDKVTKTGSTPGLASIKLLAKIVNEDDEIEDLKEALDAIEAAVNSAQLTVGVERSEGDNGRIFVNLRYYGTAG